MMLYVVQCKYKIVFTTSQDMFNFFGNSMNSWNILSKFKCESEVVLKKLNLTTGSSGVNKSTTIKLRFFDIIKFLSEITVINNNFD